MATLSVAPSSARPAVGRRSRRALAVVAALISVAAERLEARRAASELRALDDRMLADIGLRRDQIDDAVRGRPIPWRR